MFVYRLTINPLLFVDVSLDAADADENRPLNFTALPQEDGLPSVEDILAMVRDEVSALAGLQGHLLGTITTPADLHAAMSDISRYAPRLVKGREILEGYKLDPPPPGAVS